MVLNKQQSWKSLLLALFFNLQGELYYPLMTDYMGLGDKETFPLAHLVLRQPYHFVDYAVGVVGIHKTTKVCLAGHRIPSLVVQRSRPE